MDEKKEFIQTSNSENYSDFLTEQALLKCFRILGNDVPADDSINELLSIAGDFYSAERAYIFEYQKDNLFISNTYEWCAGGVEAMIDKLQNIPFENVDGWNKQFIAHGAFYMSSLEKDSCTTEEGIELLEMQGIQSLIAAPIIKGNQIIGFIGVDNPTKFHKNVQFLKTMAFIVYSEILRRKENDEEHITLTKLTEAFLSVYYVDLSTDYMRTWKIADEYKNDYGVTINYSKSMGGYVSQNILESERKRCKIQTSPGYILSQFETKDRFSIEMTDIMTGKEKNIVFDYIKVDQTGNKLVICCRDLTDSIAKEKEQSQKLQEALSMAQSASRAKTTFLNNMSHDIRTPMNAIIGFTDLASKHIDDKEKVTDYLEKIKQASDHLLSLINDVLDMSRIESGKMRIENHNENLFEIINTLKNIVQNDVNTKKLNFTVETDEIKDSEVVCDKLRLHQVLLNVLSNAVKYTGDGGTINFRACEIASDQIKAKYLFEIKDTGMGMSEEFLKTIFDPFTRVRSSTVSGIQGTGLGMAITKNIVDMMQGEIQIDSEVDKGTCVRITFDFELVSEQKKDEEKKIAESIDSKSFSGKKVLLVEDNIFNREIATEILAECGFVIDTAEDGNIAVEKMKVAKNGDYDLILMDIQMPTLNGYEATRQIRQLGTEVSKIPIIAMTANAFEEDRKLALEAGMNEHIPKPIKIDIINRVLSKILM